MLRYCRNRLVRSAIYELHYLLMKLTRIAAAVDLLVILLKFLVTLTNVSLVWSEALVVDGSSALPIIMECICATRFANNKVTIPLDCGKLAISSESSAALQSNAFKLDLLCLSLGLLECLVENVDRARYQVQHLGKFLIICFRLKEFQLSTSSSHRSTLRLRMYVGMHVCRQTACLSHPGPLVCRIL